MFGIDMAALAALAKHFEDISNVDARTDFEKEYRDWKERKRWGKQLNPDPLPMPGKMVHYWVTPDGGMACKHGPELVAAAPSIEILPEISDPVGDPFNDGTGRYQCNPSGELIPNGMFHVRALTGERFLKVEFRSVFSGDGDQDWWQKIG